MVGVRIMSGVAALGLRARPAGLADPASCLYHRAGRKASPDAVARVRRS